MTIGEPRSEGTGEHLRTLFGLKKLDYGIGDRMYESNARMGLSISIIIGIFEVIMFALMASNPSGTVPAGYDADAWVRGHLTAYGCMFAASAELFVFSVLYLNGRTRSRWVPRISVFVFDVVALGFGIYISSIDYVQGRLILTFLTMVVICTCLFIVVPVVTLITETAAFLLFFAIIDSTTGAATALAMNLFAFWVATLVVSIVRYNEKRTAVQAQLEVTEQSMHDALTGLKNRRSLNGLFDRAETGDIALAMLDVDDFKFFNDAYGHAVGDSVLRQFADVLVEVFGSASCYRSGGDEFLVIQDGVDETGLRDELHGLHRAVQQIEVDGETSLVSSSVGAVCGHADTGDDIQDMLRIADIAMYEAKRQGKDRVVFKEYEARGPGGSEARTPRSLAYKIEETDPLTGLPNYTHFRNRAARALKSPSSYENGLALVYFDVANFKAFNHEYGYEGGDAYLKSLADLMRETFKGQLVARFGEDRFVALTDGAHVTERVMDVHERAHAYQRGVTLELKAGICYPEGETDISALYDRAKLACDSIKTEFDWVYRVYDDELESQTARRNHIVNSLDAAIENGWIQVYYQPVMRTQTCRVCGAEALARWVDPELGMISPAEFVDVLEQHHLVNLLDVHVLETVCKNYRRIVEARIPPVPVSFNLSRLDFELCDIFAEVERLVAKYEVPKSMLHLEVTESALADNSELIKEQIRHFRSAGYQVWMDDFGSGYSSLNLLKEYEFDLLKIDMLFLRGLEEHEESRVIISSIVDMAKQLGIQTLAEGVETPEQLEFLREIGCEKLQGYLFSKPIPLADALSLIEDGKMKIELMESRHYYAETGRVNIIGRTPVRDAEGGEASTGVLPLAVLEYRGGTFHYLSANQSYRQLMEMIGVGSLEDAEERFSEGFNKSISTFMDVCRRVKREGGARSIDHITYGVHCNTRVSYIASDGEDADAFLICTISDADLAKSTEESKLQDAVRSMLSLYARVDLIAEDNKFVENIYLNSGQYNGEFVRDDVRTSITDYAEENVHPDDRSRFRAYYDMSTARQRLEAHELSHLSAFFRTVAPDAGYIWQLYLLIPMERAGRRLWLSCVRDVDPGAARFLPEAGGVAEEATLWESFLAIDDLCVFWKDENRRFVGANRAFMDFYGFESASEFVGMTDEDIGWNISGDDFAISEMQVIGEGLPVRNAMGDCLAKGRPRKILVDKVPLVDEGKRVGLIGLFRPIDDGNGGDVLAKGPGIFNFVSAVSRYVRAYRDHGIDFGLTCLEVADCSGCDELYGEEFSDKLAERLLDAAKKVTGNHGMLARLGPLKFAIVMQLDESGEGKLAMNAAYERAFGEITSVDGIPCSFRLKRGSATFSEAGSLDNMVLLAEQRM